MFPLASARPLAALALALALLAGGPAAAAGLPGAPFLGISAAIPAPSGAADLCQRYDWACQRSAPAQPSGRQTLTLARKINRQVNTSVRSVPDVVQYGTREVWTLPTPRGGDCEDFALLKKQELMHRGVPGQHLLLATVFAARTGSHAVLVLRLADGDYILDNMTDQIKLWSQTNYTFLRVQNPDAPDRWMAVFAAG